MPTTKIPTQGVTVAANDSLCHIDWCVFSDEARGEYLLARGSCGWMATRSPEVLGDPESFFAWLDHHHQTL